MLNNQFCLRNSISKSFPGSNQYWAVKEETEHWRLHKASYPRQQYGPWHCQLSQSHEHKEFWYQPYNVFFLWNFHNFFIPFSNYYHVVYRSTKSSAVVNKPSKAPHVTDTNQLHIQSTNLPVPQVLNKQVKICDMK